MKLRKLLQLSAMVLTLSMVAPAALPMSTAITADAATVKLTSTKVTMKVGQTKTLKVTGTTKKVTWKTSDKSVATVSKAGKITAKKVGKATITATVNSKNYTCKVTVVEKELKASFETKEVTEGNFKFSVPKVWARKTLDANGKTYIYYLPEEAVQVLTSTRINIFIKENVEKEKFDTLSEFKAAYSEDFYVNYFKTYGSTISGYKVTEYKTNLGPAYKLEVTVKYGEITYKQVQYMIYTDGVEFSVSLTNVGEVKNLDPNEAAEFIVKTLKTVK